MNLSQFSGGPNPGVAVVNAVNQGIGFMKDRNRQKLKNAALQEALSAHNVQHQQVHEYLNSQDSFTIIPKEEPTMANTSSQTATHPITGQQVPRVPIKSKNPKPTPPGVKPKKKS